MEISKNKRRNMLLIFRSERGKQEQEVQIDKCRRKKARKETKS